MRRPGHLAMAAGLSACVLFSACDKIPGDPRHHEHWKAPEDIKDFQVLYVQNCQGCHSNGSGASASIDLGNPVYAAWIPKEKMRAAIADGVPGKAMPAFGKKDGGPLTDEQVGILVDGFLKQANPGAFAGLPPYEAPLGNPQKGKAAFAAVYGARKAEEWSNPYFLATVSNQYLRTLLVVGRPELGLPDWSKARPSAPLSGEEIADMVAWLSSLRPQPGGVSQPKGGL